MHQRIKNRLSATTTKQKAEAEWHKATAEKERQQALESHAKRLTGYIDTAKTAIPVVAAGYGIVAAFLYFSLAIQFFPSGLTVGDNLLFFFVALGFGLLSILFAYLGALTLLPAVVFKTGVGKVPAAQRAHRPLHEVVWFFHAAVIQGLACAVVFAFMKWFPAPSTVALNWIFGIHLLIAVVIGCGITYLSWRDGAESSTQWGLDDWSMLGFAYGSVQLFLIPWAVVLRPNYLPGVLALSWVIGPLLWWVVMQWKSPPQPAQQPTPARWHRPQGRTAKTCFGIALAGGLGFAIVWVANMAHLWDLLNIGQSHVWPWAFCAAFIALAAYVLGTATWVHTKLEPKAAKRALDGSAIAADLPPANSPEAPKVYATERKIFHSLLPLMLIGILSLAMDFQLKGQLSAGIFRGIGLRAEQQTLRLEGDALTLVRTQARHADIPLSFCAEPDGAALVAPVDALWHGLGTRSLLRIGVAPKDAQAPDHRTAIEVPSDAVKIVRNAQARCHDIGHTVYFKSNSITPVNDMQPVADEVANTLRDLYPAPRMEDENPRPHWRLDKLIVTGHSDPMPQSDAGNQPLSQRRAESVARWLTAVPLHGTQFPGFYRRDVSGEGARELAGMQCPLAGRADDLKECHEKNRRVTVRLVFSQEPLPTPEEQAERFWQGWHAPSGTHQGRPSRP
ncbi:OmpA family protein [Acidovorax sp. NCPPB 4044]|uniref:OmpA family protein n=1 Tax=Acidovorax sp. NCPPB 4044 TaxID=2940490 RepID=UPI002303A94A|nr:OmpA family protein [Acidovorax sp. NCPPB 4044]MDA8522517.1 OmpA family protein [Acidovorax sp. NCPPB 4044]